MDQLKIALITDGITPYVTGGMQRHSANLAKYLTLAGVSVTLVHCVANDDDAPSDDQINQGLFEGQQTRLVKIISLKFPKSGKLPGHYIRNSYRYSKMVFNALNWNQFDFVYAKGFTGWFYMKQKHLGVDLPPIGVKFHGYEMFQYSPSLKQKLQAKMLRKATKWNNENADFIFSYGGKITDLILGEFKIKKSQIIDFTSGIDPQWLKLDLDSKVKDCIKFVFVGRNERRKGVFELSNVLRSLIDNGYRFEMHFIGPIPNELKIKDDRVIYHGELTGKELICQVLDKADVLVCPSHSEGMPNVILEGMARGNAVLATNVGAVNQVVDSNVGWLIEPTNELELKKTMVEILELDFNSIALKKEKALKKVAENFDWRRLSLMIMDRIEELVYG